MAYSAGFSPHPKISWVGAAPTGVASEAEYVEISVVERVDLERLEGPGCCVGCLGDGDASGAVCDDHGGDAAGEELADTAEQFDLVFVRNHDVAQRQELVGEAIGRNRGRIEHRSTPGGASDREGGDHRGDRHFELSEHDGGSRQSFDV